MSFKGDLIFVLMYYTMKKSLQKQMEEILDASLKNVEVTTDQAARIVAGQSVAALRVVSPKKTGKYAAGWNMSRIGETGFEIQGWRVQNDTYASLTHLLENGHAKVNGGRVSAKVHIRPVEEKGIATFERMIKSRI